MRVLIFGVGGMLGHKLYQRLRGDFEVFGTIRGRFNGEGPTAIFDRSTIFENVDATDNASIRHVFETVRPNCVVNAVGLIKQVPAAADTVENLCVNSIFPHRLAALSTEFGARLMCISTDCVFDGRKGNYSEIDHADARDIYGLSKYLGEINTDNVLTLRTSMIGRELGTKHSFLEWFLSNRGRSIKGYTNALFSGLPTLVLADTIREIIARQPSLTGLFHVAGDPISKFDLLLLLNEHFEAGAHIEPFEDYVIDRSLDASRFRAATDIQPTPWPEMIAQMAADPTPYDRWHSK